MDTKNTSRQLRYLEEVRIPLHRAGFETLPVEGEQLPVLWNGTPLCRITGKGSVFYRRADADTPQAEDALFRVEDIAAKTLEYMTAMEAAPQLKASGLDGDYRILADFGGTVLAGTPSKHGVQFVTWDWDYGRASDALTFSVLLRIPRLRPPSLPSNIGELGQRKNKQGAETHVFMLAGAGKFSTIID